MIYIILIAAILLFWRLYNNERQQRIAFQENLYQTLNEQNKQIQLNTAAELQKYFPEIQKLIDSLEIKHVTQVHQTNYHYSQDSISTTLFPLAPPLPRDSIAWYHNKPLPPDSIAWYHNKPLLRDSIAWYHNKPLPRDSIAWFQQPLPRDSIAWCQHFSFSLDTLCIKITGTVNVPDRRLTFSNIALNDQITTIYYWQRKRLFDWSWTPRWGKKQYTAKSHNKCNSKIETININIRRSNSRI